MSFDRDRVAAFLGAMSGIHADLFSLDVDCILLVLGLPAVLGRGLEVRSVSTRSSDMRCSTNVEEEVNADGAVLGRSELVLEVGLATASRVRHVSSRSWMPLSIVQGRQLEEATGDNGPKNTSAGDWT